MCVPLYPLGFAFFCFDFRGQGELCSSNTAENPFHHSTVLLYWWTLHPEPPVLPLSPFLFLFFSHCISWFIGTSLLFQADVHRDSVGMVRAVNFGVRLWEVAIYAGLSESLGEPTGKTSVTSFGNPLCWPDAHYFKLWSLICRRRLLW